MGEERITSDSIINKKNIYQYQSNLNDNNRMTHGNDGNIGNNGNKHMNINNNNIIGNRNRNVNGKEKITWITENRASECGNSCCLSFRDGLEDDEVPFKVLVKPCCSFDSSNLEPTKP